MPGFTDAEYRARELARDKRITRGNALNAAAQVLGTRIGQYNDKDADGQDGIDRLLSDTILVAGTLEEWLLQAGEALNAPKETPGPTISDEPSQTDGKPSETSTPPSPSASETEAIEEVQKQLGAQVEKCPDCEGEVWDNRARKQANKMKPNAPDFSCKDKDGCGWVKWPAKPKTRRAGKPSARAKAVAASVA